MSSFRFIGRKRSSLCNVQNPLSQIVLQKNSRNLPKLCNFPSNNAIYENINHSLKQESGKQMKSSSKSSNKEPVVDNEVPKFISFSANRHFMDAEVNIPSLPPLPSPSDPNFDKIFKEKIKVCNLLFNFYLPQAQINAKKIKLNALIEINRLLLKTSDVSLITQQHKDMIFNMITKNIFEQDPFISNDEKCLSTLNPSIIEPSWEHMCHVFQALITYIINYPENCKIDLVKDIIRLLNIPDNNERENLMTLLQNYLDSHKDQVQEIFKLLKSALANVICNIYTPYCVEPVLSFLRILVRKDQLSQILYTHLLPLYCHEKLYLYSSKLTNIIIKVIENGHKDHLKCISYLINHFPLQCGSKQYLFIYALSSILNIMIGQELNQIAPKLIIFFSSAVDSPYSKLAEPSLRILLKPAMTSVLFSNAELAINYLQGPLKWSSIYHWDKSVRNISGKALAIITNIHYDVLKKSHSLASHEGTTPNNNIFQSKEQYRIIDNTELISKWALIARCAHKRDQSIDLTNSLLLIQANLLNEGLNKSGKI